MSRPATEEIACLEGIAKTEGIFLLEHVTGKTFAQLICQKVILKDEEKKAFDRLIEQRKKGTPIQLILGNAYFLDFELEVRPGVFIPRPETEQLVERTIAELASSPELIVEIGTGTGAIAITLARHFPEARIIATDLNPEALVLARVNAEKLRVVERINFIQADLFNFPEADKLSGMVDLIISNPPYIPSSAIKKLPVEVRDYDPVLALDGGRDGFEKCKKILDKLPDFLAPPGLGAFEIDPLLYRPLKKYEKLSSLEFTFGVDNYENLRFLFVRQ